MIRGRLILKIEEETVVSLPSNKMIISETYMIIITFPDYNAPISMHGPH